MNRKIIIITISIFACLIGLLSIKENNKETKVTSATVSLSNKKTGWGIKRNNNEQPDLGTENKNLINTYEGIAIGNNEEKIVYLTFDEGYEAGYTEKLLDILKENDVKAAFFITGHYLNSASDLVKRMIDEGHIIGNHTVNHYSMPDLDEVKLENEIMALHKSVYEKFGYEMKYLRPPMGEYSQKTLEIVKKLGYTTTMWSFAYDDWNENKQGRTDYAKDKILSNVHNGAVILLHANSIDNCNVLNECITEIKNMGYEFKSLDEFKR